MMGILCKLFKGLCKNEKEDVKRIAYKWYIDPNDVIYELYGPVENIVKIGQRNGIVLHRDGIVEFDIVRGGAKKTVIVTIEMLMGLNYVGHYELLSK